MSLLKARLSKSRQGFTLIEIMIVVLIIGILLAIAVPNFIKARDNARLRACVANLKQIDSGKQQWAMENKKLGSDTPTTAQLTPDYVKDFPRCPSGGGYTINTVDTSPTCDITSPVAHTINALN